MKRTEIIKKLEEVIISKNDYSKGVTAFAEHILKAIEETGMKPPTALHSIGAPWYDEPVEMFLDEWEKE